MKTKAKLSIVNSSNKKPKIVLDPEQSKSNPEQLATEAFWKKEVAALKSERFATLDSAIDAIVERVIDRMKMKSGSDEELRVFLRTLFQTSGGLRATLEKHLKIG